ncbi:pentapeptide repeat-containing protein [bacterium]|nr:pentapeptide repeat-containing protein [bacterium]
MLQETPGCSYDYDPSWPNSERKCPHPVHADGLCIFHLPKLSAEEKTKLSPGSDDEKRNNEFEELFRKDFYREMKRQQMDQKTKAFDFVGFRFPDIDMSKDTLITLLGPECFQKPLHLEDAVFQSVDFSRTRIELAIFRGARFQKAIFRFAIIQSADFRWAIFKAADFGGSIFHTAEFVGVTFQSAEFLGTKFHLADFSAAILSGVIHFDGRVHEGSFLEWVNFDMMRFMRNGSLYLCKVNLVKARFLGTPLLEGENIRVVFDDVTWWRKSIFRRKALLDEFDAETHRDFLIRYQGIYNLYHQLVKIYEAKREFETAEDFHVGEMEMRRKRIWAEAKPWCRWHRRWTNSYFLYKILSNYGTSYWHALVVLCIMLLSFGVFSLLSGFSVDGHLVDYHLGLRWQLTWTDFWSALGYALSALPFKHDAVYKASAPWLEIVKGVASLVLSGQLALTLLAVRRRFKR